jgi:predicted RNA-binding protein with RPS1 domain
MVSCVVIGHKQYGLLMRLENGDEGLVDSSDIADHPVSPAGWPPIGTNVRAVVLGPTRMGRWRLTIRDGDVRVVTALENPEAEL